jgi:hypothetical protein
MEVVELRGLDPRDRVFAAQQPSTIATAALTGGCVRFADWSAGDTAGPVRP